MSIPHPEKSLSQVDNPYQAPLAPLSTMVRKGRSVLAVAKDLLIAVGLASPGILLAMASVRRIVRLGAMGMTVGACLAFLLPLVWMVREIVRTSRNA
jgi:uncharacterized YccA/Bax inhibitor family protein